MSSITILDEKDLLGGIIPDTRIDLKIVNVTDREAVQKKLAEVFGAAGEECPDGVFVKGNGSVFKSRYCYGDLLHIMSRLTGEGGCPWDVAQTHESIRINVIEEAYELAAAIDNNDVDNIAEETGDILLQAVFHADIAKRRGEFTISDVIDRLCKKLVGRHTHIFGDIKANNADEALKSWDAAKAKEKGGKDVAEQLDGLSTSLPALLYAQKTIKKLTKLGLSNNAEKSDASGLLSAAAGASAAGIDGEAELRKAVDRLVRDFLSGCVKEIK